MDTPELVPAAPGRLIDIPGAKALAPEMTEADGQEAGFKALLEALGPVNAIRFLWQFDKGRGDYTKERHDWLKDLTIDDIMKDIEQRRRQDI